MTSVFPRLGLSRAQVRWEDHLQTLTPVEKRGTVWFKREDYFAPLGYGGINGAKLRQLIWLVSRYTQAGGDAGLVSGASVKSPQLSMAAAVARHFRLRTTLVIGSNLSTARRHENVAVAERLGARFERAACAYNPALQTKVRELLATPAHRGAFHLEYGITTTTGPEDVEGFHRVGSHQVQNLPSEVDTLLVPAGSCNSVTSVLYGLSRFRPQGLRRVVLFGIGPPRLDWARDRLRQIEEVTGTEIQSLFWGDRAQYPVTLHDLHTSGFTTYQDEVPGSYAGINFHPTYEGKVLAYIRANPQWFQETWESGRACFWIVGSRPSWEAMAVALAGSGVC